MGSHIEAVKNCVKKVRDDLAQQFQGCDIRFAFVRYTDYDQPQSTRTTHIDFTKLVLYRMHNKFTKIATKLSVRCADVCRKPSVDFRGNLILCINPIEA